ncbi:MAG: hypothetical protein V3V10_07200 [Planctomycetota bacterium]
MSCCNPLKKLIEPFAPGKVIQPVRGSDDQVIEPTRVPRSGLNLEAPEVSEVSGEEFRIAREIEKPAKPNGFRRMFRRKHAFRRRSIRESLRLSQRLSRQGSVVAPVSSYMPYVVINTYDVNSSATMLHCNDLTLLSLGDVLISASGEKILVYQIEIPSGWYRAKRGILGTTAASIAAGEKLTSIEQIEAFSDDLSTGDNVTATISGGPTVSYNGSMDIQGIAKNQSITAWLDTDIPSGWEMIRITLQANRNSWTLQPHLAISSADNPAYSATHQDAPEPNCYSVVYYGRGSANKHLASVRTLLGSQSGTDYSQNVWNDWVMVILKHGGNMQVWAGRQTALYVQTDTADILETLKHVGLGIYTSSSAAALIKYKNIKVETIS